MRSTLVTIEHYGASLLLCVLLWTGPSLATETEQGTDRRNQGATAPPDGTPSYHLTNSPSLPAHRPKQPHTGRYDLRDGTDSECLKAHMGVQYMVTQNNNMLYFNIDPTSTGKTGQCGLNTSYLSLNFTGGHLEFTFRKEEQMSYVTTVRASLETSICNGCKREVFKGSIANKMLFKARVGLCYKCDTQTTLRLAENLSIKINNAQMQAFGIIDGKFGMEEECWPDYYRQVVPIILGGVAVGLCLIAILSYLLIRENRPQGYERI